MVSSVALLTVVNMWRIIESSSLTTKLTNQYDPLANVILRRKEESGVYTWKVATGWEYANK